MLTPIIDGTVHLDAAGSEDPDDVATAWEWYVTSAENDLVGAGEQATVDVADAGPWSTLVVTDNDGDVDFTSATIVAVCRRHPDGRYPVHRLRYRPYRPPAEHPSVTPTPRSLPKPTRTVAVTVAAAVGALFAVGAIVAIMFELQGFGQSAADPRPGYLIALAAGFAASVATPAIIARWFLPDVSNRTVGIAVAIRVGGAAALLGLSLTR